MSSPCPALAAACWGLLASAADPSAGGAYLAFTSALLVWGWVELSFLTGWLTGPRKTPLEPGSRGWPRFLAALGAVLWHELAILAAAALVPGGLPDLVTPNRDSNTISVFLNGNSAPACRVDFTGDGVVDFTDYLEFLNLFDAQDPRADLNGDGVIDFGDYLEFLNLYDAGC